jgi:hypothetical protein
MSGSGGVTSAPTIPESKRNNKIMLAPTAERKASDARVTTAVVSAEDDEEEDFDDADDSYDNDVDDEPDVDEDQDSDFDDDPDEYDAAEAQPVGDGGPAPYSTRSA